MRRGQERKLGGREWEKSRSRPLMCVSGDPRYRDENELVNRILYYVSTCFSDRRDVSQPRSTR